MDRLRRWYVPLIILAPAALGAYRAQVLRWYCDDIFITLRYVGNFLEGHGIVYNQGEFVEGYTHFLWLLILALSQWLGFDPLQASMNMGLASLVGVLLIFSSISYKLDRKRLSVFVPFTGLILALHKDFLIWATSGLETMFFTFLCSLAFFTYFYSDIGRKKRLLAAGFILLAAVLTRPDGALFFILGNIFLVGRLIVSRPGLRAGPVELLLFNLPFLLLYVPYMVWKYGYYGDVFPNTYYAKSAGIPYFDQGFYYIWLYFKAYFTSSLFLLGIPVVVQACRAGLRGRGGKLRESLAALSEDERTAGLVFAIGGVLLYLLAFVARVGGDFIYARFMVPAVPFMYFIIERSVLRIMRPCKTLPVLLFVFLALVVYGVEGPNRDDLLLKTRKGRPVTKSNRGIVDERHYYKYEYEIDKQVAFAKFLKPHFQGLDATVLLMGQAYMGYYADFKTCIENYGLTDSHIAHLPLEKRSRVGHEKSAPYEYLVEIGADFVFERRQRFPDKMRKFKLTAFKPGDGRVARAELITYDRELINALSERLGDAFVYSDFERHLDWYIETELNRRRPDRVLKDYLEYRDYYFLHNEDPERESVFLERLRESGVTRPETSVGEAP